VKVRYKHIHFDEKEPKVWQCHNNKTNDILAWVAWYKPWRKHCVGFMANAVFDEACLADIQDFLRQLNHPSAASMKSLDFNGDDE
jgi:hypothetical protein